MAAPFAVPLDLSPPERTELEALTRRHTSGQQLVVRARIVLAAADGGSHAQIATTLGVSIATARRWRHRWQRLGEVPLAELSVGERLADAPRPGRPVRITAEQRCQIVAVACAVPTSHDRPISQWTGREIAAELMQRGIVEQISTRHAARLLKKGISSPIACGPG